MVGRSSCFSNDQAVDGGERPRKFGGGLTPAVTQQARASAPHGAVASACGQRPTRAIAPQQSSQINGSCCPACGQGPLHLPLSAYCPDCGRAREARGLQRWDLETMPGTAFLQARPTSPLRVFEHGEPGQFFLCRVPRAGVDRCGGQIYCSEGCAQEARQSNARQAGAVKPAQAHVAHVARPH